MPKTDQKKEQKELLDKRRSGRILVQSFSRLTDEPNNLVEEILIDYDVFFRKRRADYLTGVLMKAVKRDEDPMQVPQDGWEAVNHYFKLYEITEWAMTTWLTKWKSGWETLSLQNPDLDTLGVAARNQKLDDIVKDVWGRAKAELDRLMNCDIAVPDFNSSVDMVKAREDYYEGLDKWMKGQVGAGGLNLLTKLDESLKEAITALEGEAVTGAVGLLLRKEFCRFIEVDRQLLPIQIGSGFKSTDVVRVVRFSPLDAQRGMSKGEIDDKVRGTALANFGAFFKKSWRANDIMMGRLDAACLLTECLLTKERLTAMAVKYRPGGRAALQALVAKSLPYADAGLADRIRRYFVMLQSPDPTTPSNKDWEVLIDEIVLAAHKQIVSEEWPQVAKCTLEQQYQWGQYQKEASLPARLKLSSKWKPGKASPDAMLVQIAAEAISKGKLPPFDPKTNKHRDFLEEVPLTAMQEHASLALVRLGKSLLASVPAGKAHDALEGSLIFKVTLQWIPGFFYRLVHTRRTQPDWMLVPVAILLNFALVAVLVFAWMLQRNQHLTLTNAVLATAGVVLAVVAEWVLTRRHALITAIVLLIGAGAAYLKYRPITMPDDQQLTFAAKCALSVVVIALPGLLPFRSIFVRIVGAALAGLVLLRLIWI